LTPRSTSPRCVFAYIYEGDPVAFSISKNKHRRHLDKTELAFIGAKLAKLKRGGDGSNQHGKSANFANAKIPDESKTRTEVAKELGIPPASIDSAKAIEEKATREELDDWERRCAYGDCAALAVTKLRRLPGTRQ